MLSKMIVTAVDKEINVPTINNIAEELNEFISYYKFLLKQRTQNKNHLEAISVKNPNSIVSKHIIKEIKSLNLKIDKLIDSMKKLIKKDK